MPNKSNTENFVTRAKKIHGDKYDYKNVNYINNRTPITITCPKHGDFLQTPHEHLCGCGCPYCAKEKKSELKKTTNDFINQSRAIHGDKYDYSKVNYNGPNIKTTITCPIHGDFEMRPHNHLRGQGCPKCGNLRKGSYKKNTGEEYIEKLKKIWGDSYDFSKFEYKNNHTKACVICHEKDKNGAEHGEFWIKPNDLLQGHGCPKCAQKFGKTEQKILEELQKHYNNVSYQHKEEWLKSQTSYQTFDFFLSDYNIAIEYQGKQHFQPSDRFGGIDGFKKCFARDKKKYENCKIHGIKLFYISFEKEIPSDYFSKVYTSIDDLINAIGSYVNSLKIPLNENDIKNIVEQIIDKILEL